VLAEILRGRKGMSRLSGRKDQTDHRASLPTYLNSLAHVMDVRKEIQKSRQLSHPYWMLDPWIPVRYCIPVSLPLRSEIRVTPICQKMPDLTGFRRPWVTCDDRRHTSSIVARWLRYVAAVGYRLGSEFGNFENFYLTEKNSQNFQNPIPIDSPERRI